MLPVAERGYANPQLLAETHWLAARLDDPSVRIIDARPAQQYAAGHIPGALSVPGMTLRSTHSPLELPDTEEFAALAGTLGIDDGMTVVVYDETGPPAGRVAWAFLHYSHEETKLLDGGLPKWTSEGRPLSTQEVNFPSTSFVPRPLQGVYCGLDHAKSCVGRPDVVLWDVRTEGEYAGTEPRDNPPDRAGHLPGAVHLEWTEMVDPESRTLKPAAEMRRLLEAKGVTPDKEIVTY